MGISKYHVRATLSNTYDIHSTLADCYILKYLLLNLVLKITLFFGVTGHPNI